jgi:outer membrane protein assembly factor BamB
MPEPLTQHAKFRPALAFAAMLGMFLAAAPVAGVQFVPRLGARLDVPPPLAPLTAAQVPLISGATAARLEIVRTLVAESNLDEAIDTIRELAGQESDRVVAIDERRYVSLRDYCHMQIASWPATAVKRYRDRLDPIAEQWYREGVAGRDVALLKKVVDEAFCSRWGDDALLALGELALERADFAAARRYWGQIAPQPGDNETPPSPSQWLVYPDTTLNLAEVRARMILATIRAGGLTRAADEFDAFRRSHPRASGRLAGQDGPLVPALERLLASAQQWPPVPSETNWPTFGKSPERAGVSPPIGPNLQPAWREPIRLTPPNTRVGQRVAAHFPVVSDGHVYYADGTKVYAARLSDGRPAITASGEVYREDKSQEADTFAMGGPLSLGKPSYTLLIADKTLYARVGSPVTARAQVGTSAAGDRLVGLNLSRDGLLCFRVRPEGDAWSFDGVPVSDGRNLYVAMRQSDVNPHAAVACFDAARGRMLWRTTLGAADTPAGGSMDEITSNLVTLAGERIYFNTNAGVVGALRADDGSICWLYRYDRRLQPAERDSSGVPAQWGRDPSPAVCHAGQLFVAPSDTPQLFALDAETGRLIWSTGELANATHLLGIVDGTLIVSGATLNGVDARTGRLKYAWPNGQAAGVRGMGRGVIAGNEVFWPTRQKVFVLDATTGVPSRAAIDLGPAGSEGANLIAAEGYLVAAGYDRMMAYTAETPRE